MTTMPRRPLAALAMMAGLMAGAGAALAQGGPPQDAPGHLELNEIEIKEALRPSTLAIGDLRAVFAHVLAALPERVQIYPTENYFYFRFVHNGVPYAGNIRLAAADRDSGTVHFFYGEPPTDWNSDPPEHYAALGAAEGVTVERLSPFSYRVGHGGKRVTFLLNDLSQTVPPPDLLDPDETYLGPVFDESGIRFFLVFNRRLKVFHFLLDETATVADRLATSRAGDRIQIGRRTGFAFYLQGRRKVLIGVDERQSWLNTYFDGPFDQLPENFIAGEALREAIEAADPQAKGRIDRLGNFTDRKGRYLIHPYMRYREQRDLAVFQRCMSAKSVPQSQRPRCLVISHEEAQRRDPRPLPFMRR